MPLCPRPITYSTPWLHPIVVVPKKGTTDIRLCVDFSKLNRYVVRPVNPQPTPWETVRNLPRGIKHFAVFDALKGYHQIPLTEESKDLTAFMTPFGRFRYLRLAFGLNSAGDVFTLRYGNAIDKATDGLRATEDTLIRGSTSAELVANTRKFFDACRENGITLNMRKIQWDKKDVLFGGFLLDPTGYRLDPALNKALLEFPVPTSPTDVRSFFGLANQLCNFSDEIADMLAPIKPLLKKGVLFQWLPEYQAAFEKAREHLASPKTLAYYCPRRHTRLIVDASRLNGLGFVLKQQQDDSTWRAVQAGSRFLSSAETRYAMIELECLAIAWACEKCRMFVDGLPRKQFQVWTDHAPLVPILDKQALPDIANRRLQRLKMKFDHLTFETLWIKGSDNVEADSLSRHPCAKATPEDELDEDVLVAHTAIAVFCFTEASLTSAVGPVHSEDPCASLNAMCPADRDITDDRLRELRSFASDDPTYKLVTELVIKGFPNLEARDVPEELRPYYKIHQELSVDSDGFLVRNDAFVVPHALVQTYLKRLLSMHQAAPKMLARARRSLWWPYMARDIQSFSKTCEPCEVSKPSNPAELLLTHEPAEYPFQFIHMDLGQIEGHYYLITVDQYSGYPHIHACGKSAPTSKIVAAVLELIQHFSIPEIIYSDGGPQFIQEGDFDTFCKEWGIRHILSSPYMPRSNGVAESAVKEMKKLLRGNLMSSGVPNRASTLSGLMMFRNTPRAGTGESPARLLFGHDVRDSLPCRRENLLPPLRFKAEQRLFEHSESLKPDAVRHGPQRELPLLAPSTPVRIQNPLSKKWDTTGFVVKFGINNREYIVRVGHKTIRRNRHFLKPIEVDAAPPLRQPVQAPLRPPTPVSSAFPVKPDWFQKPTLTEVDKDSDVNNCTDRDTRPRTIAFGPDHVLTDTPPAQNSLPIARSPAKSVLKPIKDRIREAFPNHNFEPSQNITYDPPIVIRYNSQTPPALKDTSPLPSTGRTPLSTGGVTSRPSRSGTEDDQSRTGEVSSGRRQPTPATTTSSSSSKTLSASPPQQGTPASHPQTRGKKVNYRQARPYHKGKKAQKVA